MNIKYRLLILSVLGVLFYSCQEEELIYNLKKIDNENSIVLGKKSQISFTTENMQKAYSNLLKNKTASIFPNSLRSKSINPNNYIVNTTHYYIKFTPEDSLQYEKIAQDTILNISDLPFEYDLDTQGENYQDPEMKGSQFTYYYSVAPIDYKLPTEVPYEKIANLHFTKEDLISVNANEQELKMVDFYHDLNTEALKISNNLGNEKEELKYIFTNSQGQEEKLNWEEALNKGLELKDLIINFNEEDYEQENFFERRRRWNPSGTINVYEDAISKTIGIQGALIKVRKWGWLVIKKGITNKNGYFKTSSTRTKRVKYACYFKNRPYFTIKAENAFWDAKDRGHRKHKRSSWRRNYTGGKTQFYALIHNASNDYYTRLIREYGLAHPGFYKRLVAKDWYYTGSHSLINIASLFYDIRITKGKGGKYRGSDGIYATTVHELTHQGHNNMDSGMFSIFHNDSNNRKLLIESWAEGVETIVTNDRYDKLTNGDYFNYSNSYIGWNYSRQKDRILEMNKYTPIVSDLIDNYDQSIKYSYLSPSPPSDKVNGYTLNQIQNALNNCRDIDCWENNLRRYFSNSTEKHLKELFDYLRKVRNNANNW